MRLALEAAAAVDHHVLLLRDEVDLATIEALIRSRFGGAWPQDEFTIAAGPETSFSGPYDVDEGVRGALGLPAWAERAVVAHVPTVRGGPLPEGLAGVDPIFDAYPRALPEGVELEALRFLVAAARRLAGAVLCAGAGLVVPRPNQDCDLIWFSPIWLDPDALRAQLAPVLGPVRSSLQDADALGVEETVMASYALYGLDVPLDVHVEAADLVPAAVAAFDWAADGAVAYHVRYAGDLETDLAFGPLSDVEAAEIAQAALAAARACRAIGDLAPGVVTDDDGFLLELATE